MITHTAMGCKSFQSILTSLIFQKPFPINRRSRCQPAVGDSVTRYFPSNLAKAGPGQLYVPNGRSRPAARYASSWQPSRSAVMLRRGGSSVGWFACLSQTWRQWIRRKTTFCRASFPCHRLPCLESPLAASQNAVPRICLGGAPDVTLFKFGGREVAYGNAKLGTL